MLNAKYIAPITSSRSFLVVDNSDAISWYVYPLISDTLPYIYQGAFNENSISEDSGGYTDISRPIRSKQ